VTVRKLVVIYCSNYLYNTTIVILIVIVIIIIILIIYIYSKLIQIEIVT